MKKSMIALKLNPSEQETDLAYRTLSKCLETIHGLFAQVRDAEAIGGHIDIESRSVDEDPVNHGTAVSVKLPCA